ncbi:uncharacterized protein LOC142652299 [Rhinoderma darwinii]|uniref:uncharacterized protein LOC142652299 n=1 Tax=Rhinoderma darwinii TaxID=43563 RepID=UPI003F67632D
MNRSRDVTLPTLLLASLTVYGFLLVWAQNDTIEFTTITEDQKSPMSPAGFHIVTGGNVSIQLAPWHSTSIMPAVTTPTQDTTVTMDSTSTSMNGATVPFPTSATNRNTSGAGTATTTSTKWSSAMTHMSGTSPGTRVNDKSMPRSIKRSRAVTNSSGRLSIRVKIQSSAPKDEAMQKFLKKACEFFHKTLQLEDVTVTLGPERTQMMCLGSNTN